MRTKILILAAMSFTMIGFSQKNEIKAAEKALKGGDAGGAKTALEAAAGAISGEDAKVQAQYHYLRGRIYADLARKGDDSAFETAISSFQKAKEVEESSGKAKYGSLIEQEMSTLAGDIVNSAIEDNKNEKYKEAGEKLYMSYKLSPRDTNYLYFAASSAVNGGEYDQALTYYNELKEVGYDGGGIEYKATNVATGEVETMEKVQRDLMVKSGTYKDPVDDKAPSKKAEIVKNMALIYTQLGQDDKALEAYKVGTCRKPK